MTIEIKSTQGNSAGLGFKAIIYGAEDSGKTRLILTAPNPEKSLLVSIEGGTASLNREAIDMVEVKSMGDLAEAYKMIAESDYETIVIDSVSELAEMLLVLELKKAQKLADENGKKVDNRAAYPAMSNQMIGMFRKFLDLKGKNIIFTAKLEMYEENDVKKTLYRPLVPGNALKNELRHRFDAVLCLKKDIEGDPRNPEINQYLLCNKDGFHMVRDRAKAFDMFEKPSLKLLIEKFNDGSNFLNQ